MHDWLKNICVFVILAAVITYLMALALIAASSPPLYSKGTYIMGNAMQIFRKELDAGASALTEVLPLHLPAERLNRTIISAVKADPELLNCERASLWKGIMTAAVFGLEIDGRQSAMIRFGKKAQLIPMVSGLITLAHNAGFIIDAQVVREKDQFDFSLGTRPVLHHVPARNAGRGADNPVIAAYAVSWPKGSREDAVFDVLELPDIIARRDKSAAWKYKKEKSPWGTDFAAMARKSAVRARANHLPWQVQKAEELEGRHERGEITNAVKMEDGTINIEGDPLDGDGQ